MTLLDVREVLSIKWVSFVEVFYIRWYWKFLYCWRGYLEFEEVLLEVGGIIIIGNDKFIILKERIKGG